MPSRTQEKSMSTRKRKRSQIEQCTSGKSLNKRKLKTRHLDAHFDSGFDMNSISNALQAFSEAQRQYLLAAYKRHSTFHPQLLAIENLEILDHQNDQQSLLLYAAVLATGLVFDEDLDSDCQLHRAGSPGRTSLHTAIRDTIEKNDVSADSGSHVSTLLLFSELERYAGYTGSANMYLREAARSLPKMQESEFYEHSSSNASGSNYSIRMACEKLLIQWSIFGQYRSPLADILMESNLPDAYTALKETPALDTSDLVEATHYAHYDLLRTSKNLVWDAASRTVLNASPKLAKQLQRWYAELPPCLQWQHRNERWTVVTFLLHQQYRAILTLTKPSSVRELISTISKYERKYPLQNAPLIVSHHVEVAASFAETGPDRSELMQILSSLSKHRPIARTMISAARAREGRGKLKRAQTAKYDQAPRPNVFNLDYADVNLSELGSEVLQEVSGSFGEQEVPPRQLEPHVHHMVDQPPSLSPGLDLDDSVLIYLNDPVFGGYIDELGHNTNQSGELGHNTNQSGELWKRSVQQSCRRGYTDHISRETWRGNDMAEQLRAFLGHDMGIRGPDVSDVSLQEKASESPWNMHSHMQTMTT